MSTASKHQPPGRTDAEFVKRLADHYAPSPLSPGQRAAWDTALATRLEKGRRAVVLPGLATAALAAALVFGLGGWFGLDRDDPGLSATAARAPVVSAEDSAADLLDAWEYLLALQPADDGEDGLLPDDYAAIASVFLEG